MGLAKTTQQGFLNAQVGQGHSLLRTWREVAAVGCLHSPRESFASIATFL